ncbi:MAG: aminotransferase class V-fold PLP-dependent enzyme [Planctomycetaceae bacterium]
MVVEVMTGMAKAHGAMVLVDGAQSVSHFPVDVRRIGCDFYVFSGHKIFGPTGIGAVYATTAAQEALPPWQGGGNMIRDVTFARTTYSDPPAKFEAGTPNIADAIGLAAALDYVTSLGRERIAAYEHVLLEHATAALATVPGLRLIGTSSAKVGVLSFVIDGRDPLEIGRALDRAGIAVRAGHHCAQPSLRHFGLEATVRPSLAFYNTTSEIDRLAEVLHRLQRQSP